jgi:hypothetical protein
LAAGLLLFMGPVSARADQELIEDRLPKVHAAAGQTCDDVRGHKNGDVKVGKFEASWKSPDDAGD